MIIKKFRIKNYKSIIDSGDCYLENNLTIFAGKNACGKTTILEALSDFSADKEISIKAKSINVNRNPEISITFELNVTDVATIARLVGKNQAEIDGSAVEITKQFPSQYNVNVNTLREKLKTSFLDESYNEFYKKLTEEYTKLVEINRELFSGITMFSLTSNLVILKTNIESYQKIIKEFVTNDAKILRAKNQVRASLNTIRSIITQIEQNRAISKQITDYLIKQIPNFILLKSFNESLESQIDINDENHRKSLILQDVNTVIERNLVSVSSLDERQRIKSLDAINERINELYSNYWNQDDTKIRISIAGSIITFWIEQNKELFEWTEESQGKQWHISFFLRVMSKANHDRKTIILLDEPGTYLHAKAQEDIYKMLVECSQKTQILFTTHSPYLILDDELHKVRLIDRDSVAVGTKIINQIHTHTKAKDEGLTPVFTAMGIGLNNNIQNVDKHYNVVVEGPSDVYYLRAFLKIIQPDSHYNFIFGKSSTKLWLIGTILDGWGCKRIFLFDNDKKDEVAKFQRDWQIDSRLIIKVKDVLGTIEDIFSKKDFVKYVLQDESIVIPESKTIGDYVKEVNVAKPLKAKLFLNLVEKEIPQLDQETLDNAKKLFDKFEEAFRAYTE